MKKTLIAFALLLGLAGSAAAQNDRPMLNQRVMKSSGTIQLVAITSHTWTQVDSNQLAGSWEVVLKSTDAVNFCCAFDTASSTITASAQGQSCIDGDLDPSSSIYKLIIRRWSQNLPIYCRSMSEIANIPDKLMRVFQKK